MEKNEAWKVLNHHALYTKINTIARSTSVVKCKTSPLVAGILGLNKQHEVAAMKWGKDHEFDALKSFYTANAPHHEDFKTEKSGLWISQKQPFVAATPDGFLVL